MASKFQDMPPPGGYRPITWERVVAKSIVNAPILGGALALATTIGLIGYGYTAMYKRREKLEKYDAFLSAEPILQAERDREYVFVNYVLIEFRMSFNNPLLRFLKQLRRNLEDEAELMKNVPGWKVGTWYGEPVYKTVDNDPVFYQDLREYYSHSHPDARVYRHFLKFRQ
ncbi:hypothetical protein CHUAL_000437 [Chamberlinius hualienensis]